MTLTIAHSTAKIAAGYFAKNTVAVADVSGIIAQIAASLAAELNPAPVVTATPQNPAVAVNKSVQNDYIVCLEDGKKLKMLKRYLMTHYGLTPEQYRRKWDLPLDYPMTAPSYSGRRSALAKESGLGRVTGSNRSEVAVEPAENPAPDVTEVETVTEVPVENVLTVLVETPAPEQAAEAASQVTGSLPDGYASLADTFTSSDNGDAIICLIDQKPVRDLGRHLSRHHNMKPGNYRERFGLPENYPMTADRIEAFNATQSV